MRIQVVVKKTLADLSDPKFLAGFLIPFSVVSILISRGFAYQVPDNLAILPLRIQEVELTSVFCQLSLIWLAGVPIMALIAIATANYIGREEEDGTMRILLSKPIKRWEVILGKFFGIFLFSFLIMMTGFFLGSIALFHFTEASSAAIRGSILSFMPVNMVYSFLISFFVTSLGTGFSVMTGNRLKTALSVILLTVLLFFGFIIIRGKTQALGVYQDYLIFTLDINHHLGNSYLVVINTIHGSLAPPIQRTLGSLGGMFIASNAGVDPLTGGMPTSLPLPDYAKPAASLTGILAISVGLLIYSVRRFRKKDIL